MPSKLEQIFDDIAEALIQSNIVNPGIVTENQKTIKNGIVQLVGTNAYDKLILFETDIKANSKDLLGATVAVTNINVGDTLETISNNIGETWVIQVTGTSTYPVIKLLDTGADGLTYDLSNILNDGEQNPINVSQFLNINKESQNIDSSLADEFLDTSIFELLGDTTTRQDRINNFFLEFQNLINNPPTFNVTDGLVDDTFSSDTYSATNDISYANDEPTVESSDKFITRLDRDNDDTENPNSNTLQSLRDTLNTYLVDIDQEFPSPEDQRPTYKNKSDGYLKFRNLNQGIIIRNTNKEFVEGLNPDTKDYLTTGFTITTWVRFLDKTSEGTLFNFGNPLRSEGAFGFSLDTFVANKSDEFQGGSPWTTYGDYVTAQSVNRYDTGEPFFTDTDTERWVRLVVIEDDGTHRDSSVGISYTGGYPKQSGNPYELNTHASDFLFTRIPVDFSEWYFIVATYDPVNITETVPSDNSNCPPNPNFLVASTDCDRNPDFWLNHINPSNGNYTANSNYGNRCKVEIISRTDLLRARGFKG